MFLVSICRVFFERSYSYGVDVSHLLQMKRMRKEESQRIPLEWNVPLLKLEESLRIVTHRPWFVELHFKNVW